MIKSLSLHWWKGSSIDDISKFRLHWDYLCDSACHANSHPLPPPPPQTGGQSVFTFTECVRRRVGLLFKVLCTLIYLCTSGMLSSMRQCHLKEIHREDNRQTKQILCIVKLNSVATVFIMYYCPTATMDRGGIISFASLKATVFSLKS